ncbi:MAG: hypothetical protein EOP48_18890 [Sphingobacteriales bacterium]|nr:MAG: hypothetical protein EOP48_18890 [Sphingobacteriales bacterium]
MKLSFKIAKDIDHTFDYLTNMDKFVSVHPVIWQIDSLGAANYLVHEKLKLGFLPFSFTYPVTIDSNEAEKRVVFRATVFKFTKIEMDFVLTSVNGTTIINEEIRIKSPLPVKFIMRSIFKKQHALLFKNIELE